MTGAGASIPAQMFLFLGVPLFVGTIVVSVAIDLWREWRDGG